VSLPVIGALLGHKHAATTGRYSHLSADPLRTANDLVGMRIAAAMERSSGDGGAADKRRSNIPFYPASLVAPKARGFLRDEGVAGSNPATPTNAMRKIKSSSPQGPPQVGWTDGERRDLRCIAACALPTFRPILSTIGLGPSTASLVIETLQPRSS
jgi:hypothetical protein